ncbi:HAD-IB family phosphatase [Clostridia bacterium OttesenSCG-928-O13]|nr:HAD-IB family phosphatase [Clostridia bacterium OttesenSCG-928-O13]
MNVYDFDKTIYDGDSTVDFYLYCLGRRPGILRSVPRQAAAFVRYGLKRIPKTRLKEIFFTYLQYAGDVDALVADFWAARRHKIFKWYAAQKRPDDVIISASPVFLLRPICDDLGVGELIASKVAVPGGQFDGSNCYGPEKVLRFLALHRRDEVDEFYSDSLSDSPMAKLAKAAFLVKKETRSPWPGTSL